MMSRGGYGSVINSDSTTRFQQQTHVKRTSSRQPESKSDKIATAVMGTLAFLIMTGVFLASIGVITLPGA